MNSHQYHFSSGFFDVRFVNTRVTSVYEVKDLSAPVSDHSTDAVCTQLVCNVSQFQLLLRSYVRVLTSRQSAEVIFAIERSQIELVSRIGLPIEWQLKNLFVLKF